MRSVLSASLCAFVAVVVSEVGLAHGASGSGFGSGGIVRTPVGNFYSGASAAVLQSDGKLIVAGGGVNGTTNADEFELARYDRQGRLDRSFGKGGTVIGKGYPALGQDFSALALQPDEKLVAAGLGSAGSLALARFTFNGGLDRSFGNGGTVRPPSGSSFHDASALIRQPDGKLIVAGSGTINSSNISFQGFALARYDENGRLDRTFGKGGTVTTALGNHAHATALVRQPDGKLLAAGSGRSGSVRVNGFALARYDQNGHLDRTFGAGGIVTTALGKGSSATAVVIQPDGKLVAAGVGYVAHYARFALVRYEPNGHLDRSFGTGGTVTTAIARQSNATALVLQPDGKLVVAGEAPLGTHGRFALARYDRNGRLDAGFGRGGTLTTAIGSQSAAYALLLQRDGKLVAVGVYSGNSQEGFALARYDARGSLDK